MGINPASGLVAYAGEDGVVGAFPGLFRDDNRQREPHTAVAGAQARLVLALSFCSSSSNGSCYIV